MGYDECSSRMEDMHARPTTPQQRKRTAMQKISERMEFIRLCQKTGWADFDELQVTDSTLNKGSY